MAPALIATPSSALVDDDIAIYATGLLPRQHVTIAAVLVDEGKTYISSAHYTADVDGRLELDKAVSVGGSYTGVEPMGLFWSMVPAPGQRPGLRLMKHDVSRPFVVKVFLLSMHRVVQSPTDVIDALATCELHRYYLAPGVRAVKVSAGNIRGMLFIPRGDGPFPGVIDMFGGAGGLIAFRSALLASRGFATLALPFFAYEDLPNDVDHINLDYFNEAVEWLAAQPCVLPTGIGMVGVSKGAAIALQAAASSSKVKAVVAINTYCVHAVGTHFRNGHKMAVLNSNDTHFTEEGIVFGRQCDIFEGLELDAILPVENIFAAEIMFIVGEDDTSSDTWHVDVLVDRLRRHGRSNYTILRYPGAGHLIEPPHMPHCRACYVRLLDNIVVYGGEPRGHARAQEDSWRHIKSFLRQQLQTSAMSSSGGRFEKKDSMPASKL